MRGLLILTVDVIDPIRQRHASVPAGRALLKNSLRQQQPRLARQRQARTDPLAPLAKQRQKQGNRNQAKPYRANLK